ncbi:MAG: ABC transporter ATP-binding protein [Sphaerochaetaceae bacterium]
MNKDLLVFEEVSKIYTSGDKKLLILDKINFTLKEGTSVAITGNSGCGKTTFLNIGGSLDKPTSGRVFYKDNQIDTLDDVGLSQFRSTNIGFIFQSHILLEDFSALENVCIPALIKKEPLRDVKKRAVKLLERVGLQQRLHHLPSKLSGGERQRVAICRALINNAELIIADEPTGSLDETASKEIEKLLFDLVKEENRTLLLVTHNLRLANECSVVYLLQNQKLQVLND